MSEVETESVGLLIGASVHLGTDVPWERYWRLYARVYCGEGVRVLRPDGFLLTMCTDAYSGGEVFPRSRLLADELTREGWRQIDTKIWNRRGVDLYRPSFSHVAVWTRHRSVSRAKIPGRSPDYFRGIWDYAEVHGFDSAYPIPLCRLIVESLSRRGDLVVDAFAGTGALLGVAAALGRRAIGYEINEELRPVIERNLSRVALQDRFL